MTDGHSVEHARLRPEVPRPLRPGRRPARPGRPATGAPCGRADLEPAPVRRAGVQGKARGACDPGGQDDRSLPFCFRTRDNRATDRNDCGEPVPRPEGVRGACKTWWVRAEGDGRMAAMKPRTGDGPLEVTKEGRGIVMRVPVEGGGRLVVELTADEAARLGDALKSVVG